LNYRDKPFAIVNPSGRFTKYLIYMVILCNGLILRITLKLDKILYGQSKNKEF